MPASRTAAGKAAAKKAPARKAPAKKASAMKASATPPDDKVAKKAPVKKAPAKKVPAQAVAPAKKTAPAKKAAAKKTAPAKKAAAKKTAPAKKPTKQPANKAASTIPRRLSHLAVRPGETPWTARQLEQVRETLRDDAVRLKAEIEAASEEIDQLLRQGGEGAGNDQADVGSHTFERDHEMSLQKNAIDNLRMVEDALERIADGSYGLCQSCGRPIGKMRLLAFPRATLCLECKQREERR